MIFEWNPEKEKANLSEHDVSFEKPQLFSATRFQRLWMTPTLSIEEQRLIIVTHSENDRLLFVSHTDGGKTVRIICA